MNTNQHEFLTMMITGARDAGISLKDLLQVIAEVESEGFGCPLSASFTAISGAAAVLAADEVTRISQDEMNKCNG